VHQVGQLPRIMKLECVDSFTQNSQYKIHEHLSIRVKSFCAGSWTDGWTDRRCYGADSPFSQLFCECM